MGIFKINDRRRPEYANLRVLINQIKTVESMSDAEWQSNYVETCKLNPNARYTPKAAWLEYLKSSALVESEKLLNSEKEAA